MIINWVNRNESPPPTTETIIVWHEQVLGESHIPTGAVAAIHDYNGWVDVSDKCDVNFTYWHHHLPSPYAGVA